MKRLQLLVAMLWIVLGACQAEESIGPQEKVVLAGLRSDYTQTDVIEFSLKNASKSAVNYWVTVERESNGEWFELYGSLEGMRDIMSEPTLTVLDPGETHTIRWRPKDDPTLLQSQRGGAGDYRIVAHWILGADGAASTGQTQSPSFRVSVADTLPRPLC